MEVFEILSTYDERIVVERASIDEAFLDLSDFTAGLSTSHKCYGEDITSTHVAGVPPYTIDHFISTSNIDLEMDAKTEESGLVIAAKVMSQLKKEIKEKTGFSCSCGISRNKIMSKLACGFKKPNGLSIFPQAGLKEVWSKTPIKKVRNLGGKLGSLLMSHFQIEMMSDLCSLSLEQLESVVDSKNAEWITGILKGNDDEMVSSRLISKSVGCGKNFSGLSSFEEVKHWVTQLSCELVERLTEDQRINQRRARSMVFGLRFKKNFENFTKTLPIHEYQVELLTEELMKTATSRITSVNNSDILREPITSLYLTASKFVNEDIFLKCAVHKTARLDRYFTSFDKNCFNQETSSKSFEETSIEHELGPDCISRNGGVEELGAQDEEIQMFDDSSNDCEVVSDECLSTIGDEDTNPNVCNSFFYRKTLQLMNKDINSC